MNKKGNKSKTPSKGKNRKAGKQDEKEEEKKRTIASVDNVEPRLLSSFLFIGFSSSFSFSLQDLLSLRN